VRNSAGSAYRQRKLFRFEIRCTDGDGVRADPLFARAAARGYDAIPFMLKLEDNPPVLPPTAGSLQEMTGTWWIAHTKARFEKAFAFDLLRRGTGYFLPLIKRVKMSGGRKRHVMLPLFPSYVFFCGGEEDRYAALATNRLCQVIAVNDQAGLLSELSALETAMASKAVLDPYPFAAVGKRCRVRSGPFEGIEGIVIERDGPTRLVLQVKMLGQGAAMEIDTDLLEPVE
jgi:transcription antitermination factor NusG